MNDKFEKRYSHVAHFFTKEQEHFSIFTGSLSMFMKHLITLSLIGTKRKKKRERERHTHTYTYTHTKTNTDKETYLQMQRSKIYEKKILIYES